MPQTLSTAATVAIIGAGPSGIAAARYLAHVGLTPVLFEQSDGVGGQWRVGSPHSAVWPGMHTNTSRVMTAFSDMPHSPDWPAFPSAVAIGAYLERYAAHYGLLGHARFGTCVEQVERDPSGNGYVLRWRGPAGEALTEHFSHVVVASGRHHRPVVPKVEGLDRFTGSGGVIHARSYGGASRHRGERVVVLGCSISALEIASELALEGAARVVLAARRHRYVLQRTLAGIPLDHRVYTRYGGMAWEALPKDQTAAALKALALSTSGHPSQFGAPVHSDDILEAGFSHSPYYLQLVAEGRITPRPFIANVDGTTVRFTDGSAEEADTIIACTGYALDLPFLGASLRETLRVDALHLDLHHHTFHPELPGLAFLGLYEHSGPYFPTLEQQARWLAYAWGGIRAMPTTNEMSKGVADHRARRGGPHTVRMHIVARLFAREAGVEPDPTRWPELARALYFGPLSPASFRLEGPDALPDAAERVVADGLAFGALAGDVLTDSEKEQLRALGVARGDAALEAFARMRGRASV